MKKHDALLGLLEDSKAIIDFAIIHLQDFNNSINPDEQYLYSHALMQEVGSLIDRVAKMRYIAENILESSQRELDRESGKPC